LLYLKSGLDSMSLPVLKKIERMVKDGIVLVGDAPQRAAGLSGLPESDKEIQAITKRLWGKIDKKTVFKNRVGKGRVYAGKTIAEVLKLESIEPDFSFRGDAGVDLSHIHRSANDLDIYYVANKWAYTDINDLRYHYRSDPPNRYVQTICSFRVDGDRQIERFDPVTGEMTPVMRYHREGDRYDIPVSLTPEGSAFYVFKRAPQRRHVTDIIKDGIPLAEGNTPLQLNASGIFVRPEGAEITRKGTYQLSWSDGRIEQIRANALPSDQFIEGPWKITFMERPSLGETMTIKTDVLKSWTEFPDRSIKYFSGTARYRKIFDFPQASGVRDQGSGRRVYLDLGNVQDLVTVRLNDKVIDTCWISPFRVDITDHVVTGRNTLELDVTNCWANRLIGDSTLPQGQRRTRSNVAGEFEKPGAAKGLRASGLLGPVRLQFADITPFPKR